MSEVEIPAEAAAEEEAPLTDWALNIEVSMSEASSKDFSLLATVLEDTALCGLIVATSRLVSFPEEVVFYFHTPLVLPLDIICALLEEREKRNWKFEM